MGGGESKPLNSPGVELGSMNPVSAVRLPGSGSVSNNVRRKMNNVSRMVGTPAASAPAPIPSAPPAPHVNEDPQPVSRARRRLQRGGYTNTSPPPGAPPMPETPPPKPPADGSPPRGMEGYVNPFEDLKPQVPQQIGGSKRRGSRGSKHSRSKHSRSKRVKKSKSKARTQKGRKH